MKIQDTLSSSLKEVQGTEGKRLNMFVCGPTVYDKSHLGHARTYIFYDTLARYLKYKGFRVFYLMNVTDMEDNIITKVKETGQHWEEITSTYSREFFEIMEALKNNSVSYYAFATDYIREIIAQISKLEKKGFAYETVDGVYYRVRKFKNYGKLSHQDLDSLVSGARVEVDERKEDPADFVLWKKKKEGEPYWDSPWGEGRPGWHIEDTAITESVFGPTYDIHGGATDLVFPHHESEIAQMEAISGKKPMVKYWVHTGHLNVENIKMSKSLKNFITLEKVLTEYWPESLRIMMLSMHFSSGVNFEEKSIRDAQSNAERISILQHRVGRADFQGTENAYDLLNSMIGPLENNMNTPEMMREILEFVKDSLSSNSLKDGEIRFVLNEIDKITGIVHDPPLPPESMEVILSLRNDMRRKGEFESADRIRNGLKSHGVRIEDSTDRSYVWW